MVSPCLLVWFKPMTGQMLRAERELKKHLIPLMVYISEYIFSTSDDLTVLREFMHGRYGEWGNLGWGVGGLGAWRYARDFFKGYLIMRKKKFY